MLLPIPSSPCLLVKWNTQSKTTWSLRFLPSKLCSALDGPLSGRDKQYFRRFRCIGARSLRLDFNVSEPFHGQALRIHEMEPFCPALLRRLCGSSDSFVIWFICFREFFSKVESVPALSLYPSSFLSMQTVIPGTVYLRQHIVDVWLDAPIHSQPQYFVPLTRVKSDSKYWNYDGIIIDSTGFGKQNAQSVL